VSVADGRRRLVVDACVVLKWQLDDEDEVERAVALRDDFLIEEAVELSAPHLLIYEIANGIWSAARRARLEPEVAQDALANLLACGIHLDSPPPERVLAVALDLGVTAYDAAYVVVAEQLRADLWTADRPLYEAAAPRWPWVRWIGDYPV
jgi:predicted nucleic acid-binding protein